MDSLGSYKKIVNEGSSDEDNLFMKPPKYSAKQADSGSTHVRVTQPASFAKTEEILPSSYLCLSMIACCFCWPMAICALRNSQESAYAAGARDFETARVTGQTAKKISIGAIVIGVLLLTFKIAYIIIYLRHLQSDIDVHNED